MNERPILFSSPMVRAILDGRKTVTRRVVKPQFAADAIPVEMPATDPAGGWVVPGHSGVWWCDAAANPDDVRRCPYGQPSDRLWVRETFSGPWCMEAQDGAAAAPPSKWAESSRIWYWADGEPAYGDWTRPRPSIHMPRWASRITLEITGVRVERLQDISEADAQAEGTTPIPDPCDHVRLACADIGCSGPQPYRTGFRALWRDINGPASWDANPWVWVVEFRRLP